MSTAILISGQLRSWRDCLPTLQWSCFRKLDDPHFYISCANDEQAKDAELIRELHKNVWIETVDQPRLEETIQMHTASAHAPYAISVPHQSIIRQAWHMQRVYQFAMENGSEKHDTFIRCRPDLWMTDCELPTPLIPTSKPGEWWVIAYHGIHCYSPWWGRFAGCNDRFAIMGKPAAAHYFNLYSQIPALLDKGCPFHPESLLLAHLEANGVEVHHTLNAVFSTLRLPEPDPQYPGQKRQERRFPEILPNEIAEYARTR